MKVLFLGDIFGEQAINKLVAKLPKLKKAHKIDFVIAQSENASGRKGLIPEDYDKLKKAGIDAFTLGNHVWAKPEIKNIINNPDIIRPFNVVKNYEGEGTKLFKVGNKTLRVTQFMGIAFNQLNKPWREKEAANFFDAFDELNEETNQDYHIIDFHAETTSEKNVFGLYVDGKVSAFIGTHTHIQTSDEKILPNGTAYITDAGMVGPIHSAIGASYETVYEKMRFDGRVRFEVSNNQIELNGVIIELSKKNTIKRIKMLL